MIEINGIPIIDYVERINHDNGRKYTEEYLMTNFSELRKKFGTVFVIPHVDENNLNDEKN